MWDIAAFAPAVTLTKRRRFETQWLTAEKNLAVLADLRGAAFLSQLLLSTGGKDDWERLFDGEADLIIHHIDKADPRLEFIDLCAVKLIPVVAPGFLRMPISEEITRRVDPLRRFAKGQTP